jgi:phage-related protein
MPNTKVVIYCEKDGTAPLIDWLDSLPTKVQDKCIVKIELLQEKGHLLRRPHCDYLDDGIYELRVRHGNVNYRIMYCFCDKKMVLLSNGFTKEKEVPKKEIQRSLRNKLSFESDRKAHTYQQEL